MLDRLAQFFRRRAVTTEPFIDEALGEFLFVRDIGWQTKVLLEGPLVNLYLGSDGENPSCEMRDIAKYWITNWESRRHELNQYMESALRTWPEEELRFAPQELKIQSIEILGPSGIIVGDGTIAGERNPQRCKTKSSTNIS